MDVDGKRHPIGFMLTMRKFDMDSLKKSTIVHQLNIDDKMETFVDIYMDDKFIVMIYEKFDSPDFYKIIQVRSTETLESYIVQTIRVKDKPSIFVIGYIHYSNGLLIFGSSRFNSSKDKPQYLKYFIKHMSIYFIFNYCTLFFLSVFPLGFMMLNLVKSLLDSSLEASLKLLGINAKIK